MRKLYFAFVLPLVFGVGFLLPMGCETLKKVEDSLPPISFCHAIDLGDGKIEVCYKTKEGLHFSFVADKKNEH